MGRVRQKGTAPELEVSRVLRQIGAGYRKNVRALPGSPDFANKTRRWAVFVHGCFWHRHRGCFRATTPKANREFWLEKFTRNRKRDADSIRALRRAGYKVVLIWECQVDRCEGRLSKVLEAGRVDVRRAVDHRGVVIDVAGLRRGR